MEMYWSFMKLAVGHVLANLTVFGRLETYYSNSIIINVFW
jgi:hypothetical protein